MQGLLESQFYDRHDFYVSTRRSCNVDKCYHATFPTKRPRISSCHCRLDHDATRPWHDVCSNSRWPPEWARYRPKISNFLGFLCVAYSAWTLSNVTTDVGYATFAIAGFFNGAGIGLVFVPLTTVSFWTLPVQYRTEASTLSSLIRTYGSGIGVSIVISCLSRTQKESHAFLTERISPFTEIISTPWLPELWSISSIRGLSALEAEINKQALSIGFLNDFHLILVGAAFGNAADFANLSGRK